MARIKELEFEFKKNLPKSPASVNRLMQNLGIKAAGI